jgi:hypothetical protein
MPCRKAPRHEVIIWLILGRERVGSVEKKSGESSRAPSTGLATPHRLSRLDSGGGIEDHELNLNWIERENEFFGPVKNSSSEPERVWWAGFSTCCRVFDLKRWERWGMKILRFGFTLVTPFAWRFNEYWAHIVRCGSSKLWTLLIGRFLSADGTYQVNIHCSVTTWSFWRCSFVAYTLSFPCIPTPVHPFSLGQKELSCTKVPDPPF